MTMSVLGIGAFPFTWSPPLLSWTADDAKIMLSPAPASASLPGRERVVQGALARRHVGRQGFELRQRGGRVLRPPGHPPRLDGAGERGKDEATDRIRPLVGKEASVQVDEIGQI